MSSALSAFNWRGAPSQIGKDFIKTGGTGAPAKDHPLRNGKKPARAVQPLDRTASINTERRKAKPVYSAE